MTPESFEALRLAVMAIGVVCSWALWYRVGVFVERVRVARLVDELAKKYRAHEPAVVHVYREGSDGKKAN